MATEQPVGKTIFKNRKWRYIEKHRHKEITSHPISIRSSALDSVEPRHSAADTLLSLSLRLVFGRHLEISVRSAGALNKTSTIQERGEDMARSTKCYLCRHILLEKMKNKEK